MTYDPSEPRDRSGKWTGGSARGHNAGGGNRELAISIAKGAAIGIAEGIVLSTAIGAVTGGIGEIAAPALIASATIRGAIAGARAGVAASHIALHSIVGGASGLEAHKNNLKSVIKSQHKRGR